MIFQEVNSTGVLYVVATPIGNLSDISLRAIEILHKVDLIAAEDTRTSKILLQHHNIQTQLTAYHNHNESQKTLQLIEKLQYGKNIALISDAGTPLISDPGYSLVSKAKADNIQVVPIPGPCALIAAMSASGIDTNQFKFIGFLPSKSKQKHQFLTDISQENTAIVFYESPHRILETLQAISEIFEPERKICIARELTKKFETIITDFVKNIAQLIESKAIIDKGEFVVILEPFQKPTSESLDPEAIRILKILLQSLSAKEAAKIASEITGIRKNIIKKFAAMLKA